MKLSSSYLAFLFASGASAAAPVCNADNCLRALRATATPGRLQAAQSLCASLTAKPAPSSTPLPAFASSACIKGVPQITSACSCIPTASMTTSTTSSTSSAVPVPSACGYPVNSPGNLLKNPGLETGQQDPWDFAPEENVDAAIADGAGYFSRYATQVNYRSTPRSNFVLGQTVDGTVPGTTYALSARYRFAKIGTCAAKVYIESQHTDNLNAASTTEWQCGILSEPYVAQDTAVYVTVQIDCIGAPNTAFIDDVVLTAVSSPA